MLSETIQLETLRQKIEDSEFEAGNQSDYLDRGKPNAAQAKRAQELIEELNRQTEASKAELRQFITNVRSQQPQALEEWINFHVGILQEITNEKATGVHAVTRRNVAKGTIQEWENVRAGQQDFVRINWHFLKDYKERVRKLNNTGAKRSDGKAWWQFWK
ncbi:MAG TPA: hypothetical protein VFG81_20060 [Anaerolineales bacterium]|jgi:hypothetical protein|nr:hypothetical protein [Anaerolineales bacterium]